MRNRNYKKIYLVVCLAIMTAFYLLPFLYMILISISSHHDFLLGDKSFNFTLTHFRQIFLHESLPFMRYLFNSVLVSFVGAFFAVFIGSLSAYAITRFHFRYKILTLLFVLALSMFPQISLVSYLFKIMSRLSWINSYKALMLPYTALSLPLSVWVLVSYFSSIPRELDKAASIDGLGPFLTLWKVILPVARPGIFSVFLLSFIFCFNEFMIALLLTKSHSVRTVPVGIALFQGLHGETPWGAIMAASLITTLPVILIIIFFQKNIISGLTRGSIKG